VSLRRLRTGKRALLLGSRRASIPAGRGRTVTVRVRRARLGARRRMRVRVQFTGRDAAGAPRRVTRRATLRR